MGKVQTGTSVVAVLPLPRTVEPPPKDGKSAANNKSNTVKRVEAPFGRLSNDDDDDDDDDEEEGGKFAILAKFRLACHGSNISADRGRKNPASIVSPEAGRDHEGARFFLFSRFILQQSPRAKRSPRDGGFQQT